MTESRTGKKKRMFSWVNPKQELRDTGKYGKGALGTAIASESSLGKDWLRQEEAQAWQSF